MMKRWLTRLNLALAVSVIGSLAAWDAFDLAGRLSGGQVEAFSWGIRIAALSVFLIAAVGIGLQIRSQRQHRGKGSLRRWAVLLAAPLLMLSGLLYFQARASAPVRYAPPAWASYAYEEVRLRLPGGDLLAGSLTLPGERGARVPAVVLITGSSAHDRDNAPPGAPRAAYRPFRQLAHRLSSRGIAVLRMDDHGVGASRGGDLSQMTTAERAEDIEACVAYLRGRPGIDPERIGLVGLSEGVSIAHMIASRDNRIRALVLLSGIGSPGREVLRYQIRQGLLSEAELADLLKTDKNTRFLDAFDPLVTARMVRQPVLILHGDRDRSVPPADAPRLGEAIRSNGNDNVTVRILAGYGHPLLKERADGTPVSALVPDEVLEIIQVWLERQI